VKAVNLIPPESRRGGAGGAGHTGGAAYVLLGGLAVVVVALAAYVLSANTVRDREAELAKVTIQADQAEARAAAARPWRAFAALKQARVETVKGLADSRFDWERVLRQLARIVPDDVWLTSLTGTVAPGVPLAGGGAGVDLRTSLPVPAIELVGCSTSQDRVASVIGRLKLIDGVSRVSLSASEKADTKGSAAAAAPSAADSAGDSGSDDSDCRHDSDRHPKFSAVVFFEGTSTAPATGANPATPGAPATPATPPAGGTAQPASASGTGGSE